MKKLKCAFVVAALSLCSLALAGQSTVKESVESDNGEVKDEACSLLPIFCGATTTGGGGGKEPPKV